MKTYELYEPFKILTPDWSCTRNDRIVREVSSFEWHIYKWFGLAKVNPFHPHLLIRTNKWASPWHFEQDYFREPTQQEVWGSIMGTFKNLAGI